MRKICILTIGTLFSLTLLGQQNTFCASKEASQFDFWLGDWDLTWNDTSKGTNRIERVFGQCAIQENFTDPVRSYFGKSWSVYNANYKMWQQTWIDNHGGYIALTGGMKGDSMILTTAEQKVPTTISPSGRLVSRMVFYNIKPDSFEWSWQASTDGGLTWKVNWHISYRRKSR